jgi:hypothetical protein
MTTRAAPAEGYRCEDARQGSGRTFTSSSLPTRVVTIIKGLHLLEPRKHKEGFSADRPDDGILTFGVLWRSVGPWALVAPGLRPPNLEGAV